jgi:anaerobic selenocysteine-containing dehydrogenase
MFYVSTRRGKQFNSMVQHEVDPLDRRLAPGRADVAAGRGEAADRDGDRVRLASPSGSFTGRARLDRIKPGNLAVHWPEGNGLLSREEIDAASHAPDYNAIVTLEKA